MCHSPQIPVKPQAKNNFYFVNQEHVNRKDSSSPKSHSETLRRTDSSMMDTKCGFEDLP
ncbi:hypothetical protein HanIR_Chr16g0794591 [Helianthus annuus]|nr:hypothetical protein HanIR_Chr16g0794591 [Helianthus annuus]